jgi:hypothetical protein
MSTGEVVPRHIESFNGRLRAECLNQHWQRFEWIIKFFPKNRILIEILLLL